MDTITYKKQKLPIKIGYFAIKMMQKEYNKNLNDVQGDLEAYEPLLYYSLMQGHKLAGKEFKFTMEDMEQILDECFFDFASKVTTFFPDDIVEKMMEGVGKNKQEK